MEKKYLYLIGRFLQQKRAYYWFSITCKKIIFTKQTNNGSGNMYKHKVVLTVNSRNTESNLTWEFGSKFFPFGVDPFLEGPLWAEKQTLSNKSYFLYKIW